MRFARRLWLPLCLLVVAARLSSADTTTDLRKVFSFMPPPRYPPEASETRSTGWRLIGGTAICRVSLDAAGAVTSVRIMKSSGNKALDAASVAALQRWRAKPGRADRFYDIPVAFKPTDSVPRAPVPNDGLGLSRGR